MSNGNIWFAIPSCRPRAEAEANLGLWRHLGYRLALLRQGEPLDAHLLMPTERYLGWAPSINLLTREILATDPDARWIVSGGDDTHPDFMHWPEAIAAQCEEHFGGTFGVMQPTGDRWCDHGDGRGAVIDRIAGSPWMGREWCDRAYEGEGPICGKYFHNYADEELQEVAIREGVFWQRRDLIHFHAHWARKRGDVRDRPAFARYINGEEYHEAKVIFHARKAAGFPHSEPLQVRAA